MEYIKIRNASLKCHNNQIEQRKISKIQESSVIEQSIDRKYGMVKKFKHLIGQTNKG